MKAVVLETRGREAAVLAMDGSVYIARGKYRVGETIDYREAKRPSVRQWAVAAAAMVALLGASAGLWVDRNYVAYAEVSLDVNPSIVYTVNCRDRVLDVRAVNEDAEGIVESLEQDGIRFMTLTDAVDRTMVLLEDEGYLDEEQADYVLVNVSADDSNRQARLTKAVEGAMSKTSERDATLEYRIDVSDRATARDARGSGMSTGRYAAWKQEEAGPEGERPDMEAYSDMPVREIIEGPSADADRGMQGNEDAKAMPQREAAAMPTATGHGAAEPKVQDDFPATVPQGSAEPQVKMDDMDAEPEKKSTEYDRDTQDMALEKPTKTQEDNSQIGGEQQVAPESQDKRDTNGESNEEPPAGQHQPNVDSRMPQSKAEGQAEPQTDEKTGGTPNKAQGNPERGGGPPGSEPKP